MWVPTRIVKHFPNLGLWDLECQNPYQLDFGFIPDLLECCCNPSWLLWSSCSVWIRKDNLKGQCYLRLYELWNIILTEVCAPYPFLPWSVHSDVKLSLSKGSWLSAHSFTFTQKPRLDLRSSSKSISWQIYFFLPVKNSTLYLAVYYFMSYFINLLFSHF